MKKHIRTSVFSLMIVTMSVLLSAGHLYAADNSLSFNGSSNYVNVPDAASLQIANGTWEAWFKTNAIGSFQAIIAKDIAGLNDDGWLGIADTGKIYFFIDKSGSIEYNIYSDSAVSTGTWYHVAVTWGSGGMKMYLNGVLQADTDANMSGIISSGNALRIGSKSSGADYFNGQIDEVRIWNVERTQAQIDQYKGVTLTGMESGLVAYYRFDEGGGTTTDNWQAAGLNDGTLINGPTWAGSGATVSYEPSTQASAVNFTAVTGTSMTVNWTPGSGGGSLVLMRAGSAVNSDPADGIVLSYSTAFGSGDQVGTGNYCVYAGTATSQTVTGLTPGTTYHVAVYEYNYVTGGGPNNKTPG